MSDSRWPARTARRFRSAARRALACWVWAAALLLLATSVQADTRGPGFVDGTRFIDLVGDDALQVEVSLHGSLLRSLFPGELKQVTSGLESVHAVILEIEDASIESKVREHASGVSRRLREGGWQRIVKVREQGTDVAIWVLEDGEAVSGLVLMIFDAEDDQFVFANIAGVLDLETIEKIGARMEIPGLDGLGR